MTHRFVFKKFSTMDLASVVEALQATLSPQLRKQAEDKLTQVQQNFSRFLVLFDGFFRFAKPPASFHVLFRSFSTNNAIWELDKLVNKRYIRLRIPN